jgi:hypothetical protein
VLCGQETGFLGHVWNGEPQSVRNPVSEIYPIKFLSCTQLQRLPCGITIASTPAIPSSSMAHTQFIRLLLVAHP